MLSYTEALRYLCGDTRPGEDRRAEACNVITDAVWEQAREECYAKGELYDWIATGDWSPAELNRLEVHSAAALAAEWNEYRQWMIWDKNQQAARDL